MVKLTDEAQFIYDALINYINGYPFNEDLDKVKLITGIDLLVEVLLDD